VRPSLGTRSCGDRPRRAGSSRLRRPFAAGRTVAASRAGIWPWRCQARLSDTACGCRRWQAAGLCQVGAELTVVDRLVHADVEGLPACRGAGRHSRLHPPGARSAAHHGALQVRSAQAGGEPPASERSATPRASTAIISPARCTDGKSHHKTARSPPVRPGHTRTARQVSQEKDEAFCLVSCLRAHPRYQPQPARPASLIGAEARSELVCGPSVAVLCCCTIL
jgi:hypothetical protein